MYAVTPVIPGVPMFLMADGAELWAHLVDGPLDDACLDERSQELLRQMEAAGIASSVVGSPNRVESLSTPSTSSVFHELVYALVDSIAHEEGIPLVFIKGPALFRQGLRNREHSGDVDCWVPLGEERRLARAMAKWGWSPAYSAFTGTAVLHSLTLRAGDWGCAIDVHSWFPGITLDPLSAFELVSSTRTQTEYGGRNVSIPSRPVHAMISALHLTRPLSGYLASSAQIAAAADVLKCAGEEMPEIVKTFRSGFALSDAMRIAFEADPTNWERFPVPPDWQWRLERSSLGVYREALRLIPARRRGVVLVQLVWGRLRSGILKNRKSISDDTIEA